MEHCTMCTYWHKCILQVKFTNQACLLLTILHFTHLNSNEFCTVKWDGHKFYPFVNLYHQNVSFSHFYHCILRTFTTHICGIVHFYHVTFWNKLAAMLLQFTILSYVSREKFKPWSMLTICFITKLHETVTIAWRNYHIWAEAPEYW